MAGKRVALVVGNSTYPKAPLTNPKNDAEDVAAALRRLQFEVMERRDMTVAAFDSAVDEFVEKAKDADVALFFFSGHGLQIDKRGFLVPVDFKAETESAALRELVAIPEVVSRVERAAKVSVVMLDACRDSPLHERMRRIAKEKDKSVLPTKGLPPLSVLGSNTLVVYATVPGEVASDGSGRNSPFTAAFLRHVETQGLDVEVLFKDVTAEVLKATRGKQQPERLSRLQTRLELLPGGGETLVAKQSPTPKVDKAEDKPFQAKVQKTEVPPAIARIVPTQQPGKVAAMVRTASGLDEQRWFTPGAGKTESFRDCPECPEMVVVPAGSFMMGSPESEAGRDSNEGPQHRVTIKQPFAVGKFEVTFAEWDACVAEGGCQRKPKAYWGRGRQPVMNVSWDDITKDFLPWLRKKTGKDYDLLSEAEWEYVARAGTTTAYSTGAGITNKQAQFSEGSLGSAGKTVEVGSFAANVFGLHDMHGNVWEWVEECGAHYPGPSNGSSRTTSECHARILRGGSFHDFPQLLRAAYRARLPQNIPFHDAGFRVSRTLRP